MTRPAPKNTPASIREKLRNVARERNADFGLILVKYGLELRRRQLHPASQQAGLGSIDWHSLRHTHGTLLHEQGTPLRVAQAQLGHSHMTTTLDIYTHASGTAQRQAVDHLESLLFPSVPKFAELGQRPN